MPNLVGREHFGTAVALNSSLWQLTTIVGPALGGLLYLAGAPTVYAIVAGGLASGLWLFEQSSPGAKAWTRTLIDAQSTGFEQPVDLADLDGDLKLEIYVASEDQHELRQYRWQTGAFVKSVLTPLVAGDITWNVTHGQL